MRNNPTIGLMISESELIEGCRKNDRASQKALYERYCRKMMVVCLRYSRGTQEAEDVLQEAFVKIFQGLKDFRGDSKLETWMTRIVINTSLNAHRRKLYLMPMVDVEDADLKEESISLSGVHHQQLIEMIQALPQGCQVVFNLFAIEGYSHKEIGEMLGISEGTSKSQFSRARSLLKEKLMRDSEYYSKYGEAKV